MGYQRRVHGEFINDASRASSMLAKATVVLGFFLITLASVRSFIVPERGIRALYDQDEMASDEEYMLQYSPILQWMLENDPTLRAKRVHGALRFHRPWHVKQSMKERWRRNIPDWFG